MCVCVYVCVCVCVCVCVLVRELVSDRRDKKETDREGQKNGDNVFL